MKLNQINMVSIIFYYHLLIQCFIGVNLALFYLDNHYLIGRLQDFDLRRQAYYVVCYVMVILPLSMVLINKILSVRPARILRTYGQEKLCWITSTKNTCEPIVLIIMTTIAVLSVLYTYANMHSLPFLMFLKGMTHEALGARIQVSRSFTGNEYIKNILGISMTPLLAYIAYGYKTLAKKRIYTYLFYILFICSLLILTYDAAKAPALWFLLGFVFLKVLLGGRVSRRMLYGSLAAVFAIIIFYYSLTGTHNFISYNSGPIGRIILSQIAGLFYMLHIFPDIYSFMGIQAFPQFFLNFFDIPLEHIRPARIVMMYVNPSGVEQGLAGVVNTLFIGEAWSMYGWIGLLLAPVVVGIIIQLFYITLLRMPKSPLNLGLYTYLCLSWPITGGFIDFVYNPSLLIILAIYIIWYMTVVLPWSTRMYRLGNKKSNILARKENNDFLLSIPNSRGDKSLKQRIEVDT